MNITSLGYLGFGAPDPAAWRGYALDIIGLAPGRVPGRPLHLPPAGDRGRAEDGSLYFRVDDWSWRIAIHPHADNAGLLYMGLEVQGPRELEQALAELAAAGHEARRGTATDAEARAVTGIGFTRDPAGNAIELFYGPLVEDGFVSPLGMRFLTGDMGLGHLNLFVADFEACEAFYTDLLGFRLTDYYHVGDEMTVNFYHVNPRHHSVGLMKLAPVNAVHHMMLEVPSVDMVGMALDRAMAAGCKITASLGRHTNDNMLSFYMASPFGFEVEIGCDAIRVGPDWTPRYRGPGDLWGHHGLTADNIQDAGEAIDRKDIAQ
ncbi:VOC family protein [Sphingobium estronivorans]|uniref:VOC family protein n=1 Tax=Sphingobium estronivorans TaxID=1577690 RepID=UPI00123AAB9A|nr:VOC family protein [Sphingobium estronivorans]